MPGISKLRGMSTGKNDPHPSQQDYDIVAAALRELMGDEFCAMADECGVNLDDMARFTPVSAALQEARLRMGLTIKALAAQLKATQSAIKAIEGCSLAEVDGALLARYADALGERAYFEGWVEANTALAHRLGVPGVAAPPPVIVPDQAPGAQSPRLIGPDEKLGDPEAAKKKAALVELIRNIPPGLLEAFDEPKKPAKKSRTTKAAGTGATWRMKIALLHLDPPIWRRFTVPDSITLAQLHDVVQIVMGWTNSHLHAFHIGKNRYERPYPNTDFDEHDPRLLDERKASLASLGLRAKSKIRYEYDFGDGWEHELVLEKILPAIPGAVPVCKEGEHGCPPEDCGGPFGYPDVLDAANDPKHPDYAHWRDWLGDFDPFHFPHEEINKSLARLGARWNRKR